MDGIIAGVFETIEQAKIKAINVFLANQHISTNKNYYSISYDRLLQTSKVNKLALESNVDEAYDLVIAFSSKDYFIIKSEEKLEPLDQNLINNMIKQYVFDNTQKPSLIGMTGPTGPQGSGLMYTGYLVQAGLYPSIGVTGTTGTSGIGTIMSSTTSAASEPIDINDNEYLTEYKKE